MKGASPSDTQPITAPSPTPIAADGHAKQSRPRLRLHRLVDRESTELSLKEMEQNATNVRDAEKRVRLYSERNDVMKRMLPSDTNQGSLARVCRALASMKRHRRRAHPRKCR
jgi:hypothetical protein